MAKEQRSEMYYSVRFQRDVWRVIKRGLFPVREKLFDAGQAYMLPETVARDYLANRDCRLIV